MASSRTSKAKTPLETALSGIPSTFRTRLIRSYTELRKRFSQAQYDSSWDTPGLSVGKFCESVLRFLQHDLTGSSIPFGTHISNFADECHKLVQLPKTSGNESLRVIIPRSLVFLYTLRGKRGIGHVGGDVEANAMDAGTATRLCDWILCELIRIYHKLSLEEAQALVDALTEREVPLIWDVAGKRRILKAGLNFKHKVLLLLYSQPDQGVLTEDLFDWVEHSHFTVFKRQVLTDLHKRRLIEYDRESELAYISPFGVREVENVVLKEK